MLFHGVVVILLGLLAGIPFAFVISGELAGSVRAWRMAISRASSTACW